MMMEEDVEGGTLGPYPDRTRTFPCRKAYTNSISDAIRDGAEGFFRTQYGTISKMAFLLAMLILCIYLFLNTPPLQEASSLGWTASAFITVAAFLLGVLSSGVALYVGMWSVRANVRVSSAARRSARKVEQGIPEDDPRNPAVIADLQEDLEAEMMRLKLELKQTMEMYRAACREALNAKQKAMELNRWRMGEENRLEEAKSLEENALPVVRCKAAAEEAEAEKE